MRPPKDPPRASKPRPQVPAGETRERTGRRERRALSHIGGEVSVHGDDVAAALLAQALQVPTSEESEAAARAHVHGFHAYPAKMHPLTARRLIEAFSRPGDAVLDPFCGSGTVPVEARLGGRLALGVDANPLAVRLAELKVRGSTARSRELLLAGAQQISSLADERRKARAGASRRYGPDDVALFDGHVLLELDGLRVGLDALASGSVRADLELVLSSILTKVSRRASDTAGYEAPRRIGAGFPARLFLRKTEELCRLLAEVADALALAPAPRLLEGDARELAGIADGSVALAVTSPPYPGVYDYLAHHAARLRWLRLSERQFEVRELGARRHLEPLGPRVGLERWQEELCGFLRAMARVLRPGGRAVLLIADSVVAGVPAFAEELVAAAGARVGLRVEARASQARPHFHRPTAQAFARRARREHAIGLIKA